MNDKKVERFLIKRGYLENKDACRSSVYKVAQYYRIVRNAKELYGLDVPHSLLNGEPPELLIIETCFPMGMTVEYHMFSVGLHGKAALGSTHFEFYSIDQEELIKKLPQYEKALLIAWTGLFDQDLYADKP